MKSLLILAVMASAGCAQSVTLPEHPQNHPANPRASVASLFESPPPGKHEMHVAQEEMAHRAPANSQAVPNEDTVRVALTDAAWSGLRMMLDAYGAISSRLSSDGIDSVDIHAGALSIHFESMTSEGADGNPHYWHMKDQLMKTIRTSVVDLRTATELSVARLAFGDLSSALGQILQLTGTPPGYEAYLFVCGMYKDVPDGGTWVQFDREARNPYFGESMLTCHSKVAPVPKAEGQ